MSHSWRGKATIGAALRRWCAQLFITLLIPIVLGACSQSTGQLQLPSGHPTTDELWVINNTSEIICHVFVRPVTSTQQVDLLQILDEEEIKAHSVRRFIRGSQPVLNVQSPYKLILESCSGLQSAEFEFSFDRGVAQTINTF